MDMETKTRFISLWRKYFNQAELPVTIYYTAQENGVELVKPGAINRCLIGALQEVRGGHSWRFDSRSVACPGGRKYLGFAENIRPNFDYFLSCGIPGQMEGERYKKSPAIVQELVNNWPSFKAPAPYIIFKRWDKLETLDQPEVVTFMASPDVLAGLFTLANYDESRPEGVFTPMSSGCASIVTYPYLEKDSPQPRGVIGMFDPSARPWAAADQLSFAVPYKRFLTMISYMEESFLITPTWKELQKRLSC
jgi:hypothetical protein